MILNYHLEENILLRNMNQTKCSAVFADSCFLITTPFWIALQNHELMNSNYHVFL